MKQLTPRTILIVTLLVMTIVIYLPITGHTLKTDDFSRIQDNSTLSTDYFRSLLHDNKSDGFYRPLNHLSFGLTYHFFGLNTYAYGVFNFILLLGSVYLLFRIAEDVATDPLFAWLLVTGWLANVKIVSSVLTWAVGRTTGMYVFFLLCAIFSIIKTAKWNVWLCITLSAFTTLLALFSKESAVVAFPLLIATIVWQRKRTEKVNIQHIVGLAVTLALVYGIYFILRNRSLAMGPASAPVYYRWNLDPLFLLNNARSYLERSLIFSVLIVPAFWATMPKASTNQPKPLFSRKASAALWLLGFAVTIGPMLPVPSKSNLYAFFPSIFIVGALASLCRHSSRWPTANQLPIRRTLVIASVVACIVVPVSWVRGASSYQHNRHVQDWCKTISSAIEHNPAKTIAINYQADEFSKTKLSQLDFTFLEMSLHLNRKNVRVIPNPTHINDDWLVFELKQSGNYKGIGQLHYRNKANKIRISSDPSLRAVGD